MAEKGTLELKIKKTEEDVHVKTMKTNGITSVNILAKC